MSKLKQYKEVLFLTIIEILAIAYDSFLFKFQKEASAWFRTYSYLGIRYVPLFIIGFLTIFTLLSVNKRRMFFVFAFYLIVDILLLFINHYFFLFYDFIGVSFILGINLAGTIYNGIVVKE